MLEGRENLKQGSAGKSGDLDESKLFQDFRTEVEEMLNFVKEKKELLREDSFKDGIGNIKAKAKKHQVLEGEIKSNTAQLKVINRTGPFDELLAQHKAEKEATVVRSSSVPEMPTETSSSILATRLKLPTGPLLKQEVLGGRAGGIQVLQPTVKPVLKDSGCDDSLHYTTGWLISIQVVC